MSSACGRATAGAPVGIDKEEGCSDGQLPILSGLGSARTRLRGPPPLAPLLHEAAASAFCGWHAVKSWRVVLVVAILVGGWRWWSDRPIAHTPGQLVARDPVQTHADGLHFSKKGYRIDVLERFAIDARVLGVAHYRFDREAEIAPVDLALGWGPMSDTAVLDRISISQGGRFYTWHVDEFPIPRRDIETHSANMHMIPANEAVELELERLRAGAVVRVEGYLVEAHARDGWHWRSSLTREDVGAGACELVWVEHVTQL